MGQLANGAFDGAGTGTFPGSHKRTFIYDFTKQGGAQGSITIGSLPAGLTVVNGYVEILTAITSGGAATAGLSSEAAGDIKATATLISAAPWTGAAGTKAATTPVFGTPASYLKMTADRNVNLVVGVADLTAGKFALVLECIGAY